MLLLVPAKAPAQRGWRVARTPHFEILTDDGESAARGAALRFEQIRQIFAGVQGKWDYFPWPIRVYLFDSEAEYRMYRPSAATEGFYHGGPQASVIVTYAGTADLWRLIFHEYVHAVLDHSRARIPRWLEEGTAEYYSTVRISAGHLVIGDRIPAHLHTLETERWWSAAELAAADDDSSIYTGNHHAGAFYAQSWALVHMLNLSPDYREHMPRFAELLVSGADPEQAFEQAFGKPLDLALQNLRGYVENRAWPVLEREWTSPEPVDVEVKQLTEAEAGRAILDLQIQLGLWEISEQRIEKLAGKNRETAETERARALVAMSRGSREEAQRHFEKAIALGSADASTYFEYAVLRRESGAPAAEVRELLEKTVALNPLYAEAHSLLGVMAANEGRHEEAIAPLQRALEVLPRRTDIWHALALAYIRTGRLDEARNAARRALAAARTRQEAGMAQAAIQMTEATDPIVDLPGRPDVSTPESWQNRRGDHSVSGTLVAIDCLGAQARLRIHHDGNETALLVTDPSKVVLRNHSAAELEFACGEQSRPITAEYVATGNTEAGTAGEVTSIEFQ